MQNFMAIFTATPESRARSGWTKLDESERKARQAAGVRAWNAWVDTHKEAIVHHGSPLGKTKRADAAGITDATNAITAFTIVQADSHEAAARIFENHPHFIMFPGEAIDIMPCLPIPMA